MEKKCFEFMEHFGSHLEPFPHILKEFEEIEKKLDFQVFQLKSQGISLSRKTPKSNFFFISSNPFKM